MIRAAEQLGIVNTIAAIGFRPVQVWFFKRVFPDLIGVGVPDIFPDRTHSWNRFLQIPKVQYDKRFAGVNRRSFSPVKRKLTITVASESSCFI